MAHFTNIKSHAVAIPSNDVDTDQIIPARYLKVTDKAGLGAALFADWRYNPDGSPKPEFVLNTPNAQSAQILLAGDNFGCGSSREHAPWALTGYGFRAVVSTSFADIFRNNALKNGLLPVVVDAEVHAELMNAVARAPLAELSVDLERQALTLPGGREVSFPIDPFSKTCLLKGTDELGYLLSFEREIAAFENAERARSGPTGQPA
ncbi:MAG TPA: 3-isopropylmalate dehydratase small subunit [Vicinamibacterales bacterium]|nr:3-isopropylmalate dehydratase small subunit [Vicinamibacterales bacterium]